MSTRKSTATAAVVKVTTTDATAVSITATTTTTPTLVTATVTEAVTLATASKVEHATTATATKPTTAASDIVAETKSEMETNASTAAGNSSEKEITTIAANSSTTTSKEEPIKAEASKLGETKRFTRNSPLPITASDKTADKKITDSEPTNSESEEGSISGGAVKKIRGRKPLKEAVKDAKDTNALTEQKEKQSETVTASKEHKDNNKNADIAKDSKDSKDIKESKDIPKDLKANVSKDTSASSSNTSTASSSNSATSTTTTNRLTRKSAAQDLAATTRITRNRQSSGSRSETPHAHSLAGRGRRTGARKMPVPMVETTTKRKRSDEDGSSSTGNAEPGAKYIKIEVKNDAEDAVSNDSVKIKQELIESDDATTTTAADTNATSTATTTTTASRGRGRWGPRKPVVAAANLQNSPNTRATRQTKVNSPSPSPSMSSTGSEAKRRRTTTSAATGSTVLRSSSSNSLPKSSQGHHDEDSKDSMASSMDELLCDIKVEKLTPELDDEEFEMAVEEKEELTAALVVSEAAKKEETTTEKETSAKVAAEKITSEKSTSVKTTLEKPISEKAMSEISTKMEQATPAKKTPITITKAANGVAEPLSVDTAAPARLGALPSVEPCVVPAVAASTSASKLSTDKAASLSPELVSEGVCEISVKQFYKKPQFLENNLGIEEDPKLGEIVQKVSTEKAVVAGSVPDELVDDDKSYDELSLSSLKEGELLLDESTDEKKSTNTNEDNISLSTENMSPLGLEIDEEEVDDDEEPALVVDETQIQTQEELTEAVEAEQEDDDAATVEESETISMDNNASTEDVREREEMEAAEIAEDKADFAEKCEVKKQQDDNNKTGEKCDKNEAAQNEFDLKAVTDLNTQRETLRKSMETKMETTVAEQKDVKVETLKDNLTTKPLNTVAAAANEHIKKDEKKELQKMEVYKEATTKFDLESEQVIAKIDAELEAIGAKEKQTKEQNVVKLRKDLKVAKEEEEEQQQQQQVKEEEQEMLIEEKAKETKALITKIEILAEKFNTNASEKDLVSQEHHVKAPNAPELNRTAEAEEECLASTNTSPAKLANKEEDTHSTKSGQSTDTNSWITLDLEYDEETLRQKEQHLQNLGLLTHKAAEQRRQEFIQNSAAAVEASQRQATTKRNGKAAAAHEYTGTLKTVIKLNRSAGAAAGPSSSNNGAGNRKNTGVVKDAAGARRQSLKMTFQKGRGRGQAADRAADNQAHLEDSYYTIQNENEGAPKSTPVTEQTNLYTHGRKSYNRSNTTSSTNTTTNSATVDSSSHSEGHDATNAASTSCKNTEKEEILIPEKASSFKFHPGRLCQDQCFYCSGKFGLYDTPCHVGQIKSTDRQQKILENEEKLTVDNCLCDACFRHVDRRANVPSYKKRLTASGHPETSSSVATYTVDTLTTESHQTSGATIEEAQTRKCLVPECAHPAAHSLRRKCIRKSVKKFLLNFDMPAGGSYVSLCQAHYDAVIQCSGCVLCKRRLGKNHMYHITSDTDRLEKALSEMGIPVQLGIGTAVCKLCRYFANLLMKPPDSSKSQKAEFVKNYRKRLLQFHNIHDGSNDASEADEEDHIAPASTSTTTTPQKQTQQATLDTGGNESIETTPAKELPSPTGSTGSSVELIGVAPATTKAAATSAAAASASKNSANSQMLLDNDVLVDYDVPMISSESNGSSPSPPAAAAVSNNNNNNNNNNNQMSKLKAILQSSTSSATAYDERTDISNVLRSNPNISMRELFPGEEDLGLQFKAPFGSNSSQRTPEGWTRVQTFLQYDEPTRRLWEELQKPYGNQSSFLRHLILLEKYFRNGDLVLTPHASSNASVYTQTVRQRLNSYDKGHCGGLDTVPKKATAVQDKNNTVNSDVIAVDESNGEDEDTHTEALSKELRSRSVSVDKLAKQLNTNAVTITARPKDSKDAISASASPHKSLLIGNSSSSSNSSLKEKEMPPAITTITPSTTNLAAAAAAAAAVLASSSSSTTSSNSRSILKSNLLGLNNKSVEILPISAANHAVNKASVPTAETKQQKILDVANKLLGNQLEAAAASNANNSASTSGNNNSNKTGAVVSLLTSPPELVSLQRRASSSGSAGPSTTVASVAVVAPTAASVPAATSNSTTASLINAKRPHLLPKAVTNNNRSAPPNVVILPDTLTPQERLQSKSWRPTLMPVEENQHLVNKAGPLYQTADGRRLPALVQVQSGGKPFLISIFDYNRMCILRREKLLRDQMLKATKNRREQQQQQQQQQQQRNAASAAAAAAAAQANMHNAYNSVASKQQQAAQQQLIHLQLMQMQKQQQKQQQQAALKSIARFQPIAPKPIASSVNSATTTNTSAASTSVASGGNQNMQQQQQQNFSAPMMPLLASAITSAANAAAVANANNAAAAAAAANASWLWNNFPDANQMLMNGAGATAAGKQLPHLLPKPSSASYTTTAAKQQHQQQQQQHHQQQQQHHQQQQQHHQQQQHQHQQHQQHQHQHQLMLDNTLMSKIPKSLTVIPQHKLMMTGNNVGLGTSGNKE